jgi:hypothetical protein
MPEATETEITDYIAALKQHDFFEFELENASREFPLDFGDWMAQKFDKVERRDYHFEAM